MHQPGGMQPCLGHIGFNCRGIGGGIININILEFIPIFLALDTWGSFFHHSSLTFQCDNQSVVEISNSGTTRDENMLMVLRALTLLTLRLDVSICAVHVPGRLNIIADQLSRSQATPEFIEQMGLMSAPTPIRASTQAWRGL